MERMIEVLDKKHLRPLQKDSYECMARCCDTAATTSDLQHCCQNCERKVQIAEKTVQVSMNEFQERLQRCVQRCQDSAQESLPVSPSDKDVAKAQTKLAECAANCAQEYERQIPKLQSSIIERLRQRWFWGIFCLHSMIAGWYLVFSNRNKYLSSNLQSN